MVERDVNAPPSGPSSEGPQNPPPPISPHQPGGRKNFNENYREYLQALKNAWAEVDVEALDVNALKAAREATELAAEGCWGTAGSAGTLGTFGGSVGTFGSAGTMGSWGVAEVDSLHSASLRSAPLRRRAPHAASYGTAATSASYGPAGRREVSAELAANCYGSLGTAGTIGTITGTAGTAFCLGTAGSFGVAEVDSLS